MSMPKIRAAFSPKILFFTSGVSREKWYWAGSAGSPTLAEHLYAGGAPRDRVREQRMADAAADVKRFDEQLVQVERARRFRSGFTE